MTLKINSNHPSTLYKFLPEGAYFITNISHANCVYKKVAPTDSFDAIKIHLDDLSFNLVYCIPDLSVIEVDIVDIRMEVKI